MSRCNYILSDYLGLVHLGLPQASRMEFVQDIVRMLQIALIWMFAVSPRYAPDMCMYVCMYVLHFYVYFIEQVSSVCIYVSPS